MHTAATRTSATAGLDTAASPSSTRAVDVVAAAARRPGEVCMFLGLGTGAASCLLHIGKLSDVACAPFGQQSLKTEEVWRVTFGDAFDGAVKIAVRLLQR